jgi:uncharacterized membrane protein YdbT with pleckstrin-like domain
MATVIAAAPTGSQPSIQPSHAATVADDRKEQEILKLSPAMFRDRPIWFLVLLLLIIGGCVAATSVPEIGFGAAGLGAFLLLIWWLREKSTTLTVTNKRTILRRGLLSKNTREVRHSDVRFLEVKQTLGQRLVGIGSIAISSAAQGEIEIAVRGIKHPQHVKDTIDGYRP